MIKKKENYKKIKTYIKELVFPYIIIARTLTAHNICLTHILYMLMP